MPTGNMDSGPAFRTGFWPRPITEEDRQSWIDFYRPLPFTEEQWQRANAILRRSSDRSIDGSSDLFWYRGALDRPIDGSSDLLKYRGALGTKDNINIRPETVESPWRLPATAPRPRDHHRHHLQVDASFHLNVYRGPKRTVDIRPEMVHAPIGGPPPAPRPPSHPSSIASICNTSEPMGIGDTMSEMVHAPIKGPPPASQPRPLPLSIAAMCNKSNPMSIDALIDAPDDSPNTVIRDTTAKATATESPPSQGNAVPTDPKDILGPLLRTLPNQQRRSEGTQIVAAPPLYAPVPRRQSDLAILDYEDSSEVADREERDDGLVHNGTHDVVMHDASMDDDPRHHTI